MQAQPVVEQRPRANRSWVAWPIPRARREFRRIDLVPPKLWMRDEEESLALFFVPGLDGGSQLAGWKERVAVSEAEVRRLADQMGGAPCVRGMRIPVATVVGMVADGMSESEILATYPYLEPEDVREAIRYAAEDVREREFPHDTSG